MGIIKKVIGGTLAIGGIFGAYKFIGLKWTAIVITFIIIVIILIKVWKKKEGEPEEENGGYFSGIFTD